MSEGGIANNDYAERTKLSELRIGEDRGREGRERNWKENRERRKPFKVRNKERGN